jgi:general secretion pathway protein E
VTDQFSGRYDRTLLGKILGDKFRLQESKLEEALAYQREKGGRLGEALVRLRALREEELLEGLAAQYEIPWIPQLEAVSVDHDLIKKVPIAFARRYRVLPLRHEGGVIVVATTDPLETVALDDLRLLLGTPIKPVLTTVVSLLACLNRV